MAMLLLQLQLQSLDGFRNYTGKGSGELRVHDQFERGVSVSSLDASTGW